LLSKLNSARIPNPTETSSPKYPVADMRRFVAAASHRPLDDNAATDTATPSLRQTEN
jgi:hypothetical protein